jgi:hypothetical protein
VRAGYDGHFIVRGYERRGNESVSCIPNNFERFLSITVGNLRFIDSLQFLNSSLDRLAANLQRTDFIHTARHTPQDKLHLLLRKGVFPYEYWSGPERAVEKQLPPREAFFSHLTGEHISIEDYLHAQSVWSAFDMDDLGAYHDLYLKVSQ